jgi:hypothetical protein
MYELHAYAVAYIFSLFEFEWWPIIKAHCIVLTSTDQSERALWSETDAVNSTTMTKQIT